MALAEVLQPVAVGSSPQRDFLDYVSIFSGLIGALLAGVAIAYAARQGAQSKQDLIRERRLDFELRILAEIRRQMSITQLQHLSGYVAALIVNPDDETDLPLLRAVLNVKSGPVGRLRREEIDPSSMAPGNRMNFVTEAVAEEVDAAIQRRIEAK